MSETPETPLVEQNTRTGSMNVVAISSLFRLLERASKHRALKTVGQEKIPDSGIKLETRHLLSEVPDLRISLLLVRDFDQNESAAR